MSEQMQRSSGSGHSGKILLAIALIAGLGLAVAGYWFFFMRGYVSTDDARLAGELIDLTPEIGGTLAQVAVNAGEEVRRDQTVFQLDARLLKAALAQQTATLETARASLTAAQARYQKAVNGPRPAEIRVAAAAARRTAAEENLAQQELQRSEALFRQATITSESLDRARAGYEAARASRAQAEAALELLREGTRAEDLASAKGDLDGAQSRVAEAEAAVAKAAADLARTKVASPVDGWVVRRWLDPGAMVSAGRPVLTVFDPATLHVDANIEEKSLHDVAVGDQAEIQLDAYPGLVLRGTVSRILRAANSQFSLIPAEGVSGTYIKVSQRVPLRITVEAPPGLILGPGLSVEVKVRIGSAGSAPGSIHG